MPARTKDRDVESTSDILRPLDGFPSLAQFISSDPDRTSLVFKRFDELAARNLLYLQSELLELEAKQNAFDGEDKVLGSNEIEDQITMGAGTSWESFRDAADVIGNARQKQRMQLVHDIRSKLKEYREALMFESTLAAIQPPPPRTFDAIHHASRRFNKTEKRLYTIFSSHSAELYSTNDDLVLLKQPKYEDRLTRFVQRYLPVLFASEKREHNMAYVPERRIARFVTIISILMAVILLFVAIITLYVITRPTVKLVMIGVYMLLFAGSIGVFTAAKRSEVFAATAAYAAVLVVFVSGNLGSNT